MIDEETDLSDGHDTNSGKELQDEYGSEEDLKKGIEKDSTAGQIIHQKKTKQK